MFPTLRCGYIENKKVLFIPSILKDNFEKGQIYPVISGGKVYPLRCISSAGRLVLYVPAIFSSQFEVGRLYNLATSYTRKLGKGEYPKPTGRNMNKTIE